MYMLHIDVHIGPSQKFLVPPRVGEPSGDVFCKANQMKIIGYLTGPVVLGRESTKWFRYTCLEATFVERFIFYIQNLH